MNLDALCQIQNSLLLLAVWVPKRLKLLMLISASAIAWAPITWQPVPLGPLSILVPLVEELSWLLGPAYIFFFNSLNCKEFVFLFFSLIVSSGRDAKNLPIHSAQFCTICCCVMHTFWSLVWIPSDFNSFFLILIWYVQIFKKNVWLNHNWSNYFEVQSFLVET